MSHSRGIMDDVEAALRACMADTPKDHPDYAEIQRRLSDQTPITEAIGRRGTCESVGIVKGFSPSPVKPVLTDTLN